MSTQNTLEKLHFIALLFVSTTVLLCLGCASPNRYRESLTDYGFGLGKFSGNITVIPSQRLQKMTIEEWSGTNGFTIVGHSFFSNSQQSEFDAVDVAKSIGATHIILFRQYLYTYEHDEMRTGYDVGTSTTVTSFSGQANTYGNIYSPYNYGSVNYSQATYGSGSATSTTTTYTPYHYQVHVSTPIFEHKAYYLVINK